MARSSPSVRLRGETPQKGEVAGRAGEDELPTDANNAERSWHKTPGTDAIPEKRIESGGIMCACDLGVLQRVNGHGPPPEQR